MESRNLLPQNTRMMANLLSFSGGALDVFCHMYYHSLVATQTGNILLLVADWRNSSMYYNLLRCFSIFFFSLGFLWACGLKTTVRMLIGEFMVCSTLCDDSYPAFSTFKCLD